jgi:Fur family ferric uptake transcriptional regulator
MTHNFLDYPRKMRSGGYRVTPQRKAILDAICEAGRRVTIEEILRTLQKKSPSLNRTTVYRNLTFLQRMRLVDASGTGKVRKFEITSIKPHHHLVCRECGYEEGLDPKVVNRFREMIRRDRSFLIDNDHLSFQGICSKCSSGRSRKSKGASVSMK